MASPAPPSPPSPSASFYDVSDDDEGEYNTIRHTESGKGVKLLYTKSKVYVHPSPSAKDNIPGFIALIQQKSPKNTNDARPTSSSSAKSVSSSSLLLAWMPESALGDAYDTYVKVDLSDSSSPPKTSYLVPPPPTTSSHTVTPGYAFAIPVSEIYSLLVRPPSLGWWFGSVVVNTRAGDSFPALFFHDSECQSTILQRKKLAKETFDPFGDGGGMFWGGDEVLRWLKRYVTIERSGADPSIYLIEPTEDDKQSFGKNAPGSAKKNKDGEASSAQTPGKRDGGMDPVTKAFKEARWNILEKLSQVTTFTRKTAQAVADNPKIPPQVRRLIQNPEVQTLQDEFDSARIYLARWAMGIAEQSERERNQRIWTAKDVLAMEQGDLGDFEILDMDKMTMADRRKPVTLEEWRGFFDSTGRLELTPDEVKERVFHGGLDPDDGVRKEAWLFLLGVYDWDSNEEERRANINSRRDEYIRLKGSWWERMVEGNQTEEQAEWWKEQKNRIEKDVHRTDRTIPIFEGEDIPHPDPDSPFADVGTNVHLEQMKDMLLTYNEYNKDLGYVQGMSDLLAPIYAVMQDDAIAFWGFVGFMDRMERNFLRDQSGMRKQLMTLDHLVQLMDPKLYLHLQSADSTNFFFFFRMLLVWYKREFEWADVLRLWESLWTDYYSSNFHIFIALAILEKHRDVIIAHLKHFDEVLKYVNELSGTMDLESTLVRAESLFRRFQRTVETVDKKGNFPSAPQARNRKLAAALVAGPGPAPKPREELPQASSSGSDKGKQPSTEDGSDAKVISPELRGLLSKKVEVLTKEDVVKKGGGVGSEEGASDNYVAVLLHFKSRTSMEYLNRILGHPSKSISLKSPQPLAFQPWTQAFRRHDAAPLLAQELFADTVHHHDRQDDQHPGRRRKRKHYHGRHKMSPCSGPWSRDLASLKKSISSIPSDHKSAFTSASNDALDLFCDPEALHVWETDSDIDSLLQLTSILAKLCDLGVRESKDAVKGMERGMVIIAEEDRRSKGHFGRLCELVEHLTGECGSKHLEGTVRSFANASIVVIRGWNNQPGSGSSAGQDIERVVKRVSTALQRALSATKTHKIVWHHGAVITSLLSFINTTTPSLRNALAGISVTDSLHLATSVKPSAAGRSNTLPDLERLQSYAKKLGTPVLFLDSSTQSVTSPYLASYMYFFAYYIHTFLPSALTQAHLHAAQDELVTFAFRLRGAGEKRYRSDVVNLLKKHLDPRSKLWARQCIDPRSYEKAKCQGAGKETEVHHAVQLADSPFSLFKAAYGAGNEGVAAFARLPVGPASPATATKEVFIAAPVDISFSTSRLRARHPSNFYVLLPKPDVTEENIANRIQGLMMGVLERVRQEHGNPIFSSNEKQMWKDVVKACSWALSGCNGKMPEKIAEKVKFVQEKLTKGTWGYVVGAPGDETKVVPAGGGSGAASANIAALAAFSGTVPGVQNAYAQGYGQQQMQMPNGYASHGQQGMMNLPVPSQARHPPQQTQPYVQGHQHTGQVAMNPVAYQQGNEYGHGHGQGQVSGYGQGVSPPGYGQAQQIPGGYPPTPQGGYARMDGRW